MRFVTILFLAINTASFAQNYGEEIERIIDEFSQLEDYVIKAKVYVSGEESYNFSAAVYSSRKLGSYISVDGNETLVNSKFAIAVDHMEKTIRVDKGDFSDNEKRKNGDKGDLGLGNLKENINESVKVSYLGKTDSYKTYVVEGDGDVVKTVVKISLSTGFFKEIEVFYGSDDIAISSYKVVYTEFGMNPKFKKGFFNEKKFITKNSDGRFLPAAKYAGYSVIE